MASRRIFLQSGLALGAVGLLGAPSAAAAVRHAAAARRSSAPAPPADGTPAPQTDLAPPPDIFDSQALDLDFWVKPRVLSVVRPASGEHARLMYWKDGEVIDAAYQELCHLLRDVNGKATAAIDPKLFETLWGTQAFIARYGIEQPLEILSGYRTADSNNKLIEAGVPAARQSLHIEGRAADIRIASLPPEVLGGLIRSFRQGGVGYYYRKGPKGGWIHADTGLQRSWKG